MLSDHTKIRQEYTEVNVNEVMCEWIVIMITIIED